MEQRLNLRALAGICEFHISFFIFFDNSPPNHKLYLTTFLECDRHTGFTLIKKSTVMKAN